MIPSIETIVEDLLAGEIEKGEAVNLLHQHAENAGRDLRDEMAMRAMQGILGNPEASSAALDGSPGIKKGKPFCVVSKLAYAAADQMLEERQK